MAFIEYIIDIVRNGAAIQQKVNAERDATDTSRISPARVIQLNGNPLSENNALPVTLKSEEIGATNSPVATSDAGTFSLNSLLKRLLTKIPSLVGGRLPVDGSGTIQPISGTVSVSNFPASSGSGGGTQYTDGVAQSTPVGNVVLGNKSGNLKAIQLDTNNYLQTSAPDLTNKLGTVGDAANTSGTLLQQVRAIGDTGAIRYGDGTTQATPFGSLALAKGGGANAGKVVGLQVDANGFLQTSIPGAISLPTGASTETTLATLSAKLPAALVSGRLSVDGSAVTQPVSALSLGTIGDASNVAGSALAILRFLGESLNRAAITSAVSISASGDSTVIAATAARQIVITNLYFTVDATANITFKNGAASISGAMPLSTFGIDDTRIVLSTNTAFVINVSSTANVRGFVTYYLM